MEMDFSVTKDGRPLSKELYKWDEDARMFSSNVDGLVLVFESRRGILFRTAHNCTFKTNSYCMFNTGYGCTFNTDDNCMFDTESSCIFKTGSGCVFKTNYSCTFETGTKCIVVRRDMFEVMQLQPNMITRSNGIGIPGFEVMFPKHTITIDGKEIELSEKSFNELKKQLVN